MSTKIKTVYVSPRWYEGELGFYCHKCNNYEYHYFYDFEDPNSWHSEIALFLRNHQMLSCHNCNTELDWCQYPKSSDKTESIAGALKYLIENKNYLPACMIYSSASEYHLNSLLYACLVDLSNYEPSTAMNHADGTQSNGEVVRLLRILVNEKIKTIVLPSRNDIIHGREFGQNPKYYLEKLILMHNTMQKWINTLPSNLYKSNTIELKRWFGYMKYFQDYFKEKLKQ